MRRRLQFETLQARELLTLVGDPPPADPPATECTLRAALMETNADPDLNRISFRLADSVAGDGPGTVTVNSTADRGDANPGDGVCDTGEPFQLGDPVATMTIIPSSPLPPIRDQLDLDGRRDADSLGVVPGVAIDGSAAGAANGLEVRAFNVVIRGLSIQKFNKSGIAVLAPYVQIANNYIGTDLEGKRDRGNVEHGVLVDNVAHVWVGASETDTKGNVISGNGKNGVTVTGPKAKQNYVSRNLIGLTADGRGVIANDGSGVVIAGGATGNMVGPPELCLEDHDDPWPCFNVIAGNREQGVVLRDAGTEQNTVLDNRIGTDREGEYSLGNEQFGIVIDTSAARNTISGNLVSGNRRGGVKLEGAGVDENVLIGNRIGLNLDGTAALPNIGPGVWIRATGSGGPKRNRIGTDGDGCDDVDEVNVISGNREDGIHIEGVGADENSVSGNIVGLDPTALIIIGNRGAGVRISGGASRNRVGMDDLPEAGDGAERNTIAGNGVPGAPDSAGVLITGDGTSQNVVAGNWIGTNSNGTAALGNFGDGVRIEAGASDNRVVAGTTRTPNVVTANVISGQGTQLPDFDGDGFNGVRITGSDTTGNTVQGNLIGTTSDPSQPLGNQGHGIVIDGGSERNRIGDGVDDTVDGGSANVIAFNRRHGVSVAGNGTRNTVRGNSISENGLLGINLVGNDDAETLVTLNDFPDSDSGPNRLVNYPVIYYASPDGPDGDWVYEGQIRTEESAMLTLDFYTNPTSDPSGYGEGAGWKAQVSVDPAQNQGSFQFTSDEISGIAGTTTTPDGSTSEFGSRLVIPVDLDADTDNTGRIEGTQQEEDDEQRAPGMIMLFNWDDDNQDDIPDFENRYAFTDSEGRPVVDDDLIPVLVRSWETPDLQLDGFELRLEFDDTDLRFWKDRQRAQRLTEPKWELSGQSFEGVDLYVEGIAPGQSVVTLSLVSPLGTVVGSDSLMISVVNPDLTAYRPKTDDYGKPFQRHEIPESEEVQPGIGIRRNGDDDNGGKVPDRDETFVENENDLVEFTWSAKPIAGVTYQLDRSNDKIRVFDRENKSKPLLDDSNTSAVDLASQTEDDELWAEWPGDGSGSSDVILQVVDSRYGRVVERASTEKLRFSPFDSLVIVIGGRDQYPADPVNDQSHGIFRLAIDLYRRDGYDVRMYQENKDVNGNAAGGAAIEEIRSAVKERGVKKIALIGYSQGGGSVYDLSDRMSKEFGGVNDQFKNDFSLEFTAYVDAVTDNDSKILGDSAFFPEKRRPVGTKFHLNQYQTPRITDLYSVLHGAPSGADREIDRSPLGVNHVTIDDHPTVKREIKDELRRRVRR